MKHLVLVGAGLAHVKFMHAWARRPCPDVRITWVAPTVRLVQTDRLAQWVAGRCAIDDIALALPPLAAAAGASWLKADVAVLDAPQRLIQLTSGETLAYDWLSVDTECAVDRDAISGAREHALLAHPLEHFIHLWDALVALAQNEVLSLVVVGGSAQGAELALAAQRSLGKRARVAWVTGPGGLLPEWPEDLRARTRELLKRGQVTLFEDSCVAISGTQMQLGQGMRLACDAPVWVPDPEQPAWLSASGLGCDEGAHVQTTPTGQSVSHPEVLVDADRLADGAVRVPVSLRVANLRRLLLGGVLRVPGPASSRYVLQCCDGTALLRWGPVTLQGRLAEWIERTRARRVRARYGVRSALRERDKNTKPLDRSDLPVLHDGDPR